MPTAAPGCSPTSEDGIHIRDDDGRKVKGRITGRKYRIMDLNN